MRPKRNFINPSSLVLMGVPKSFCEYTLDDFDTFNDSGLKEVKKFVSDYIQNIHSNLKNGRGIMFIGSNGVGKSMLSCIILKEAYTYRYTCRRITFSAYIQEYTRSWNVDRDEKESAEINFNSTYRSIELLVLEEIGKEIDSKIAKPILEDLLRYREEHNLSTIICCNITPSEFVDLYGKSIQSLVNGSCSLVKIVSEDRR